MIYDEHSVGGLVAALEASRAFTPLNQHLPKNDTQSSSFLIRPLPEYERVQAGQKHLYAPASLIGDALSERVGTICHQIQQG